MIDTRLALMTGVDIPVPELQVSLHQPTIKEISFIGEKDFFVGTQCLCLFKSMFVQDKSVLDSVSNFQIFMTIMNDKSTAEKKFAVQQVLTVLLPKYKIMFTPRSLILSKDGQNITIDDNNFDIFQNVLRLIFCTKEGPMTQQGFNPADEKAKEIADKLMRGRKRVAEQKGQANSSLLSQYISILAVGIESMSVQDLINLTMFQLYDLIERYSLYTSWDIDIRSRLAGGKPDEHPDNWMKNIH